MIAQLDKTFVKARPSKLWGRLLAYGLFEGRPLTTKGQWFNPVVFAFFRLCRSLPYKQLVDDPVFIVGMGRSGTTALGSVLSMHRDIAYLNEPKALWHSVDDNEDLIGSYSENIGQYRLDVKTADAQKRRGVAGVYKTLLKLTGTSKVVDKYPELLFRIPYVLALFPNAKFIMLTRNGIDNCKSISKWCEEHSTSAGQAKHDWWGVDNRKWNAICDQLVPEQKDLVICKDKIEVFQSNFDKASVEWIVTSREIITALQKYPDSAFRVDYDDLCSNPADTLNGLVSFIGLDLTDEVFEKYGRATMARQTVSAKAEVSRHVEQAFNSVMSNLGYSGIRPNLKTRRSK